MQTLQVSIHGHILLGEMAVQLLERVHPGDDVHHLKPTTDRGPALLHLLRSRSILLPCGLQSLVAKEGN